jgi:hypothetical protein
LIDLRIHLQELVLRDRYPRVKLGPLEEKVHEVLVKLCYPFTEMEEVISADGRLILAKFHQFIH